MLRTGDSEGFIVRRTVKPSALTSRIAEQYHFNTARIREAQRRLTDTGDTISEIGAQVGYRSLTHFERMFKKFTSLPPSVYREIAGADAGSASAETRNQRSSHSRKTDSSCSACTGLAR